VRVGGAVQGAGPQVDRGAAGEVACHWAVGDRWRQQLGGEVRQHQVHDGGLQGTQREAPARRVGGEVAAAVRLHARLL